MKGRVKMSLRMKGNIIIIGIVMLVIVLIGTSAGIKYFGLSIGVATMILVGFAMLWMLIFMVVAATRTRHNN